MTKNEIIEGIKNESLQFEDLDEIYKNDKKIVSIAVQQNGYTLQYSSKELKNDKDVVLVAVKQHGDVLKFASKQLKNDKEIVLSAFKERRWALLYASEEIRNEIGDNNPVDYLEFVILKENKQKIKDKLVNILNVKSNNQSVIKKNKI